ncbi:uncharacterized protein LOC134426000 [Melospiza melodia melodia]|uniref:uncharacterized protein LOC134426000 n=1 Tax=Melospiza melodia melodia TaxID=1914991 RepID=UPI002FD2C775
MASLRFHRLWQKTRWGRTFCFPPPRFAAGGLKFHGAKKFFLLLLRSMLRWSLLLPPPSLSPGGWECPLKPAPASQTPPSDMGAAPVSEASSTPLSEPSLQEIPSPPLQAVPPVVSLASPPPQEPVSGKAEETALPAIDLLLSNSDAPPLLPAPLLPVCAATETATAPPQRTPESAAGDGAGPLPCLPPLSGPGDAAAACSRASPPPQAETVPESVAENGAEPARPSEQPAADLTISMIPSSAGSSAARVTAAFQASPSITHSPAGPHPGPAPPMAGPPALGLPQEVAPEAGLSFSGAGAAHQLTFAAVQLPGFRIGVLCGLGGGVSVAVPWRLPSLPPLLCPSGEGEGAPESSAFGPQLGGGGAVLLWETNIPRPEMKILGAASISSLLACLSGLGERKRLTTRAAIVLAAGFRPVEMQSLPYEFGLGRWAQEVPGPGPSLGLLLFLGVLVSPTGPGPPL